MAARKAPAKKAAKKKAPAKKKAVAKKQASAKKRASAKKKAPAHRLERYQSMRDFAKTAEPSGASGRPRPARATASSCSATGPARLHYDLRLEMDGVLVSWAVPEGPDARPEGAPPGRARRGPPARLLRLRGRDPAAASTAAAT